MALIDLLGYAAASLTTLAFVPQVVQVIKNPATEGISLPMYAVFVLGVCLWLAYGWLMQAWPVVLANALTAVLAASIAGITWHRRRGLKRD